MYLLGNVNNYSYSGLHRNSHHSDFYIFKAGIGITSIIFMSEKLNRRTVGFRHGLTQPKCPRKVKPYPRAILLKERRK